ncbi:MAG: nucleoside recognition domain-containing protein [Rhodospirillaceae bacterium]
MNLLSDVILPAGRSAMDLCLFVLLPVMVVMLSIMRLLEARGVLDWLVARLAPLLRPLGLTGLGVCAALQITLVNFAAPVATLAIMEQRGTSDRHLAATLAMVLALAQANSAFPLGALGLRLGPLLICSVIGGLVAAAVTYYGFGRALPAEEHLVDDRPHHAEAEGGRGVLDIINRAGAEAFRITIGAIPLLILSLVAVIGLQRAGAVEGLTWLLGPLLGRAGIGGEIVLPAFTKYLAGGTAMMGVMDTLLRQGQITVDLLNHSAGFLVHPMDLPGVAVLISAGRRVAAVWKPAVLGACIGIAVRTLAHIWLL